MNLPDKENSSGTSTDDESSSTNLLGLKKLGFLFKAVLAQFACDFKAFFKDPLLKSLQPESTFSAPEKQEKLGAELLSDNKIQEVSYLVCAVVFFASATVLVNFLSGLTSFRGLFFQLLLAPLGFVFLNYVGYLFTLLFGAKKTFSQYLLVVFEEMPVLLVVNAAFLVLGRLFTSEGSFLFTAPGTILGLLSFYRVLVKLQFTNQKRKRAFIGAVVVLGLLITLPALYQLWALKDFNKALGGSEQITQLEALTKKIEDAMASEEFNQALARKMAEYEKLMREQEKAQVQKVRPAPAKPIPAKQKSAKANAANLDEVNQAGQIDQKTQIDEMAQFDDEEVIDQADQINQIQMDEDMNYETGY